MGRKKLPLPENIEVTGIAAKGKALARVNEQVIFIDHAVPGDRVDIQVTRKKRKYMEGRVVKFRSLSGERTDPFCMHFGTCGGCCWQDLQYSRQLVYKEQEVVDALERIGAIQTGERRPILASPETRHYRNKLEYTFSPSRWLSREEINSKEVIADRRALGFHIPGMFNRILDIRECFLQPEPSDTIRNKAREIALEQGPGFYDQEKHQGFLRNLVLRTTTTGDVMVLLSVGQDDRQKLSAYLDKLHASVEGISSLMYVVNTKKNDTIHDLEPVLFRGRDHIIEKLGDLQCRIGPGSFFQTNTRQAKQMYDVILEFTGLTGSENVYDLYTGTGTIANYIASRASRVLGLEYIEEATEDAKGNAALNEIDNTVFLAGDIKDLLNASLVEEYGRPDVIITDPPRAGMHPDVVRSILDIAPERIVYVSCNPATQARDIKLLSEKYTLGIIQPVDMFPHTFHVENIVLLRRVP